MVNRRGYIFTDPSILHKIWIGKTERKGHPGRGNGVAVSHSFTFLKRGSNANKAVFNKNMY